MEKNNQRPKKLVIALKENPNKKPKEVLKVMRKEEEKEKERVGEIIDKNDQSETSDEKILQSLRNLKSNQGRVREVLNVEDVQKIYQQNKIEKKN